MASQFDDLSKSATGLLKDSFPFDRDGKPRSVVLLKATAKSACGSGLTASFENTDVATSSVETTCKHGETDIKSTFSTKDSAISGAATRVVKGAKVGLTAKVTNKKDAAFSITPSVDYSNETVAVRAKVEITNPIAKPSAKSELSLVVKRDKIAIGAQAKLTDKAPTFASLVLNYNSNYNIGLTAERKELNPFTFGAFFNVFHQVAESKTKLALSGKVGLGPLADPSVKGAILFPLNDDTTAGIYADSDFHLASSLHVKVNKNLSVAGSCYAPFSTFLGATDDARVVGLSVEYTE